MRRTLIALAATTGLIGLGSVGASAAPVRVPGQATDVHQADWYCGPRCEYWRHRRWEHHEWREHHHPYYGYNNGYYGYGYAYRYR